MSDDEAAYEIVKKATSTPFLIKLWQILSDPDNQEAIHWNPDGQGFTIEDPDALEEILVGYFRSKLFSSFQRQLNYFTFKKVGKRGYSHELFSKDRPEDVLKIKRKTNTGNLNKNRKGSSRKRVKRQDNTHPDRNGNNSSSSNGKHHGAEPQRRRSTRGAALASLKRSHELAMESDDFEEDDDEDAENEAIKDYTVLGQNSEPVASAPPRPQIKFVPLPKKQKADGDKYNNDPNLVPITPMTPFYPME